jgi:ATP sulfurylase
MLTDGQELPSEFTRHEIADILGRHYRSARAQA